MKNQALFSLKDKSKKLKFCLLQFLFGALRVNRNFQILLLLRVLFTCANFTVFQYFLTSIPHCRSIQYFFIYNSNFLHFLNISLFALQTWTSF